MEEEVKYNAKNIDVNNSDSMFVNGVLFGLMHGIELCMADRVIGCKEGNKIASLINTTLDSAWGKMYESFDLIRKHKRVPDLDAMVKELTSNPKYQECKKDMAKTLDDMWETLNK